MPTLTSISPFQMSTQHSVQSKDSTSQDEEQDQETSLLRSDMSSMSSTLSNRIDQKNIESSSTRQPPSRSACRISGLGGMQMKVLNCIFNFCTEYLVRVGGYELSKHRSYPKAKSLFSSFHLQNHHRRGLSSSWLRIIPLNCSS